MRNEKQAVPPGNSIRLCGLHWLLVHNFGSADSGHEYIALQWNPGSKRWTHSYSEIEIDTSGFEYVCDIPFPEPGTVQ